MKKKIGNALALYPTPLVVVGAMVDGKPNWLLVGHLGIIGHDHVMVSLAAAHYTNRVLNEAGKLDYRALKPVLFEMPTYEYLRTGDVLGKCMTFGQGKADRDTK